MDSYWLKHFPLPEVGTECPIDAEYDVVIVGGGMAGLATAYWLNGKVGSVCVLESRGVGSGATGRNGGHLFPSSLPDGRIAERHGKEAAKACWEFERDTVRRILAFLDEHGVEAHVDLPGALMGFEQQEELDDAKQDLETWKDLAHESSLVEGSRWFVGGLLARPAGSWVPLCMVRKLVEVCGADILLGRAEKVETGKVHVAGGGVLRARKGVVLATNAYTSALLPGVPICPVRAQCLAVEGHLDTSLLWDDGDVYAANAPGGKVVLGGCRAWGGWEEGITDDTTVHPNVSLHLREAATRLFPGGEVEMEWTGIMGFTPDGQPLVGESSTPGVYLIAGFHGEGMPKIFGAGRLLAALLARETPDFPDILKVYNPQRFP